MNSKTETTFPFALWLYCEMVRNKKDALDMEVETGLSHCTFQSYLRGATTPTMSNLALILDVFDKHIEFVDNHGNMADVITLTS